MCKQGTFLERGKKKVRDGETGGGARMREDGETVKRESELKGLWRLFSTANE